MRSAQRPLHFATAYLAVPRNARGTRAGCRVGSAVQVPLLLIAGIALLSHLPQSFVDNLFSFSTVHVARRAGSTGTASLARRGLETTEQSRAEPNNLPRFTWVHFADSAHGWITGGIPTDSISGSDGLILATTDGGTTWRLQSKTDWTIWAGYFVDARHGWVLSGDGTIAGTSDGGVHWTRQKYVNRLLTSAHFTDTKDGWVVGVLGTILATSNGGVTWDSETAPDDTNLFAVHFPDGKHGWAAGAGGKILATNNGGLRGGRRVQAYKVTSPPCSSWMLRVCCARQSKWGQIRLASLKIT